MGVKSVSLFKNWGFNSFDELVNSFGLNPALVGDLLEIQGFEHYVFKYGDTQVLKIPKKNFVTHFSQGEYKKSEAKVLQDYLSKYLVDSTIYENKEIKKLYAIVQEYVVDARPITTNLLKDAAIRQSFENFWSDVIKLYLFTGYSLDIVGAEGSYGFIRDALLQIFGKAKAELKLTNIVLDKNNKIKIIDDRIVMTRLSNTKTISGKIYGVYGKMERAYTRLYVLILLRK